MVQHKRAHKWAFPLGVILTALAVVGAVTLGRLAWGGIKQWRENPKEKLEFEQFLSKIILHDPDPFDSVGAVPIGNIPQLLDISIWAILWPGEDVARGLRDPNDGSVLIKQEMVDAEFTKIFGQPPAKHASIEGSDFGIFYDPAARVYRLPVTGTLEIYYPRVRTPIKRTGSAIELTVDYLAYNDFKLEDGSFRPVDPDPAKTMVITLYEQQGVEGYPWRVGSIVPPAGGPDSVAGEPRLSQAAQP